MTPEHRQEMLSAYLDDELTSEERAQVEGWLAESAELRKTRDDLLAIRGQLRSLPRHALNRDLAGSVVRRAERAVAVPKGPVKSGGHASPGDDSQNGWLRGAGWRRLAWPLLAIAAALLIQVFSKPPVEERQVAQHAPREQGSLQAAKPRTESDAAPAVGADAARPASEDRSVAGDHNERRAANEGAAPAQKTLRDMPASAAKAADAPRAAPATKPGAPPPELSAEPEQVVEFDVTPEFVRTRQLEHILISNKVIWNRLDEKDRARRAANQVVPLAKEEASRQDAAKQNAIAAETAAADGPIEEFDVKVTPVQLQQITRELRQDQARVLRMRSLDMRQQSREYGKNADLYKIPPSENKISATADKDQLKAAQQQTVTIRLRTLEGKAPDQKAEP